MVLFGTHDSGHNALHRAHKPSSLAYTPNSEVWHTHHKLQTPSLAYTPHSETGIQTTNRNGTHTILRTRLPNLSTRATAHRLRPRTTVHVATAHELRLTDYGPTCYGTRATAHGLRSTTPQHTSYGSWITTHDATAHKPRLTNSDPHSKPSPNRATYHQNTSLHTAIHQQIIKLIK